MSDCSPVSELKAATVELKAPVLLLSAIHVACNFNLINTHVHQWAKGACVGHSFISSEAGN